MSRIQDIVPLTGPLNDTIDQERIQSGEGVVLDRVNMRPDAVGNLFANVPVKGTVQIPFQEGLEPYTEGINKTVGRCIDFENEAIIWLVWNSEGKHCIYRYGTSEDTITAIFHHKDDPGLNLSNAITNPTVIDGRLYWNDNTDQPKSFNIQKAINFTAGLLTDAYINADRPFNENIFPYIKRPPRLKPYVVYESLTNFEGQEIIFNNLRKKQWQIKYCYVYEDFQESAYSPISSLPMPPADVDSFGVWVEPITTNNAIKITINTGNNNVKSIKIAVRDSSNLNVGPFYIFETIDKFDSNGNNILANDLKYSLYFLNNTNLTNIDTDRGNAYFHNVPLRAKDCILLDKKYISMSEPTEGYDFKETDVDYSLEAVNQLVTFENSQVQMDTASGTDLNKRWLRVIIPSTFYADSEYVVQYACDSITATATYITTDTAPANYPESVRDDLYDQLITATPCPIEGFGVIKYSTDSIDIWWDKDTIYTGDLSFKGKVVTPGYPYVYRSLKRGQYHPFAIVYNDGFGRYNVAFGEEKLFSPLLFGPVLENQIVKARVTIRHKPPIWATTYRLAYIPYNSYTYMLQLPVVEQVRGTGSNGIPTNKTFLKINQAIIRINEGYPNSIIEAYLWQNGDRVRQIGYNTSYELLEEYSRIYEQGGESIVETGYLCDHEFFAPFDGDKIGGLEIYRPNRTPQDKAYVEIAEEWVILNPGTEDRSHGGGLQNQSSDLTTPAVSQLDFGDVYFRQRLPFDVEGAVLLAECNDHSDYYVSTGISIGRGVVRTESKQSTLKRVTRSENYIEDSELNRLNIFIPGSEFFELSEQDGVITRIIQKGDILKVVQAHKETSIYIGKNYTKDGEGNDIVLITDRTFGSFNRYEAYNGSKYPNTVVQSEDYIYYLDTFTGDLMRSASNGTISLPKQYGMEKTFNEKCREFTQFSGEKDVLVSIEPNNQSVYISFIMGGTIETIVFSENDSNKGFMFRLELNNGSVIPEQFAWFGDWMYSWENGNLHIHGQGPENSFYGSEFKEAMVEWAVNKFPELQKTFEVISLDSNGEWSALMTIDADNNYPFGQYTSIFKEMFQNREGVLTAAIPRNIRDQKGGDNIQRLYSGNKMKGHFGRFRLSSESFNTLREVKVLMINQM